MSVITDSWLAGSTQRWHATWYMSNVDDSVSAHSARVAELILQFSASPSAALLAHAITHDDGEQGSFDIPGPIKKRLSRATKEELYAIERDAFDCLWNDHPTLSKGLTDDESKLLKMCDMLDAYLMVKRYAPDHLSGDGWPETKKEILKMADNLSLYGEVVGVVVAWF